MSKSAIVTLLLFASTSAFAALSPREVMVKNEEARKIPDSVAKASLATKSGDKERVKEFTWWRKLLDDGVHFNTLTRFHAPAEVKGEGILFLEKGADQNEVLMYLPAYKKIRRVESQNQSSSFMGSEFSYADIATPHVDDYSYKMLKEENCPAFEGGQEHAGVKCHVVESTPVSDAVKERTGYSRLVSWVRSDNFMHVQVEFHDQGGTLVKRMQASEIKEVDPAKKKLMHMRVRMESVAKGKVTVLKFADVKTGQQIPDATFTQASLSKEK
ncbi:MAG TPA: outer membrane lipoprotein-sorting protein [Bdellovibrionota bacterium]|nr:outer membrane lipoprotein-sorting protein [Bdellovibrionota bacterium]